MTDGIALPADLAPALRERVLALLDEVRPAVVPRYDGRRARQQRENRCVVCHRGGVLGGHHGADGTVEWIHRSCHRKLHRRDAPAMQVAS